MEIWSGRERLLAGFAELVGSFSGCSILTKESARGGNTKEGSEPAAAGSVSKAW